jgi:hypothetical protein
VLIRFRIVVGVHGPLGRGAYDHAAHRADGSANGSSRGADRRARHAANAGG